MTRVLYIDCIAGVAGDMLLGALIEAGADRDEVTEGLRRLPVEGLDLKVDYEERHGIRAARVRVAPEGEDVHRTWREVRELIETAGLPERPQALALEAFRRLAEAEGQVHGMPADEVHFHEVGARDAIGDICGVALAVESLAVQEVRCSPLPLGRGFVTAAHGVLPLPAPATVELLRGAPIRGVDIETELVTPTGAALVTAMADSYGSLPSCTLEATGYGAGARDLEELPNVVRVLVGTRVAETSDVAVVEATIDDMPPELVPDAATSCLEAGALDVWTTPVGMKKGRPGVLLSALARLADEDRVARAMLRETSTLGVRISSARRVELEREWQEVDVEGGTVRIKVGRLDGIVINASPEHSDCVAVAHASGRPVKDVWEQAFALGRRVVERNGP